MIDPSAEGRTRSVAKIASTFEAGGFQGIEREIAADIFRVIARDVEVRVRETLASHLKKSADLPHDIALALARDVDSVALPVLEFSDVLTETDLVGIVGGHNAVVQGAIARRSHVSASLSEALVEHGDESVVSVLVANEGADIADDTFDKVVTGFSASDSVQGALVGRSKLPVGVSERLVTLVSDSLRKTLVARHKVDPELVGELVQGSRERTTLGLLGPDAERTDVFELVDHLKSNGRLTPTIVLRALFMGDIMFFEAALAARAGATVINARKLIHDQGSLGLTAIYDRAEMPAHLFTAVRIALDVAAETQYDGTARDRERYTRRMIERILTQCEDVGEANLDYLMNKLGELSEALDEESSVAEV